MEAHNEEAAELAARAAKQGADAAKNAGRAVKAVAEPVLEDIQDNAEKLEGTVEDAVRHVANKGYLRAAGQAGVGVLALGASIYAGKFAFDKIVGAIGYARGTSAAVSDYMSQ